MNLPNRLTVARIIATPLFMAAMLIPFPHHYIVALILFCVASITDWLDGYIARSRNLITDFGKFLDPLADKMLTTAAFIAFCAQDFGVGIAWALFIVLFREFLIASMRLVAVSSAKKAVIPANIWGKLKTVTQMAAIIVGILTLCFVDAKVVPALHTYLNCGFNITLWLSTVFTILSGVIYMKDGKKYINSSK